MGGRSILGASFFHFQLAQYFKATRGQCVADRLFSLQGLARTATQVAPSRLEPLG
jgi:hypothetical protein